MAVSTLRVITGGRAGEKDPGPPRVRADAGLIAELYEKHAAAVYGRCRYLLRDAEAAKDALQEVFARALKALREFRAAARAALAEALPGIELPEGDEP